MDTIIMEEEEDYGNIKITQHALRVSVFKVWKLMDTIIMEEEEDENYIRCIKPVFFHAKYCTVHFLTTAK